METLSSPFTVIYKFVFTTAWPLGFGVLPMVAFLNRDPQAWGFLAMWIGGSAFIGRGCAPLKRVQLRGRTLVISNYSEEICVPVHEIVDVRQNRLINIRPITVTFRHDTQFGRSIRFMPRRSFRLFSEDVVVSRLRELAVSAALERRSHGRDHVRAHRALRSDGMIE